MRIFRNVTVGVVFLIMVGLAATAILQRPAFAQENLLQNPSFEGQYSGYTPRTAQEQADCPSGFCSTVQTPAGWEPWWVKERESDANPEYKPATRDVPGPARVRSGDRAGQYFTYYKTHKAGLYQQVTVPAGARVQFTVWGQTWISEGDDPAVSDPGTAANMRVGIDPTGGTNPYGSAIVWSDPKNPFNSYQEFSVQAQAQGEQVTVFLFANPDPNQWDAQYGVKNTNIYWDDASLTVVGQGAPPPPQTGEETGGENGSASSADPGVSTAPVVVGPTATPNAEGVIYAEVQSGDSYWSIAARHGLTIDEIYELNNASEGEFVQAGDLLVVGYGEPETESAAPETEADSVEAAETEAIAAAPTATLPAPSPTPADRGGEICLKAFLDANQNGTQEAGEALKPAVAFTISNNEGVVSNYVTDGSSEPYCITGLEAGEYRITRSTAAGEALTTAGDWSVSVVDGGSQTYGFGSYLGGEGSSTQRTMASEEVAATNSSANVEDAAIEASTQEAPAEGSMMSLVLIAAVVVAVLLLLGVLIVILSARRSTI